MSWPIFELLLARPKPAPRTSMGKLAGVTTYMTGQAPPKKSEKAPYTATKEGEAKRAASRVQTVSRADKPA